MIFFFFFPAAIAFFHVADKRKISIGKTPRDSYGENYILDPPLVVCISHHVTGFCKSTHNSSIGPSKKLSSQPFVTSILYYTHTPSPAHALTHSRVYIYTYSGRYAKTAIPKPAINKQSAFFR